MTSGDLRFTDSAYATSVNHFLPRPFYGIYSGGAVADVSLSGWMMRHTLFDGDSPCHFVYYMLFAAPPPGHLAAVGGRI